MPPAPIGAMISYGPTRAPGSNGMRVGILAYRSQEAARRYRPSTPRFSSENDNGRRCRRPLSIELREDSLSTAPESVCHACTSRPRPILCVFRSGTVARRLLLRRRYHARRSEYPEYHVVTEAAASPGHTSRGSSAVSFCVLDESTRECSPSPSRTSWIVAEDPATRLQHAMLWQQQA